MGYKYFNEHKDETIRKHKLSFEKRLKIMRYFLAAATIIVQNLRSEKLLQEVKNLFREQFGAPGIKTIAASIAVILLSVKEYLRCKITGDTRNAKTTCVTYGDNHRQVTHVALKESMIIEPSKIILCNPGHVEQ
jgi:hypothetical protein